MSPRRVPVAAVAAAALATGALAGCASNSASSDGQPTSPATAPNSTPVTTTPPSSAPVTTTPVTTTPVMPTPPSSAPGSSGGRTMSPPHIVCHQNPFTMRYDGTQPHPVELCIRTGTAGRLVISEPAGATWPLPTTSPAGLVVAHGTRSGRTLVVSTATLAVPGTSWRLEIAVV